MKIKKSMYPFMVAFTMGITLPSFAQVGINITDPKPGSILDVTATDKGMLVPRVDIADLNTIAPVTGGATESLVVYNTNTSTGKGFYYWDGSIWKTLDPGWKLEGNANTDPGVTANKHFLGTKDNKDLVLGTNATERARFYRNGQLAINTNSIFSYE